MNILKHNSSFTEEEALEMNKNPRRLIQHIEQARQKGFVDTFSWTRIVVYKKEQKKCIPDSFNVNFISDEGMKMIKENNYVYSPYGFNFISAIGLLVLGTQDSSILKDILEQEYPLFEKTALKDNVEIMQKEKQCALAFGEKLKNLKKSDNNNSNG